MFGLGEKRRIKILETEKLELENKIQELSMYSKEKIKDLEGKIEKLEDEKNDLIKKFEEESAEKKGEFQEIKKVVHGYSEEVFQLDNKNKMLQAKCLNLKQENENLQNQMQTTMQTLQEMQLQSKTLEGERQILVNEKYNLQKEVALAHENYERVQRSLEINIGNLTREQEKNDEIKKLCNQIKKELNEKNEKIKNMEIDFAKKTRNLEEEKNILQNNFEKEKKLLQEMQKKLNEKDEEFEISKLIVADLEENNKTLREEIVSTKQTLSTLQEEFLRAKEQVEKEMRKKMFISVEKIASSSLSVEFSEDLEDVRISSESVQKYLAHQKVKQKFDQIKQEIDSLMISYENEEIEEKKIEFLKIAGIISIFDIQRLLENRDAIDFLKKYIKIRDVNMIYQQIDILSILAYSKAKLKQREELEANNLAQRGMFEIFYKINQEHNMEEE